VGLAESGAGGIATRSAVSRVGARLNGQSTVEYALVGALVVIAAAGAMALLGEQVSSVFGRITGTLSGTGAAAGH
jgi:Flp pilus assembly pilin Flp